MYCTGSMHCGLKWIALSFIYSPHTHGDVEYVLRQKFYSNTVCKFYIGRVGKCKEFIRPIYSVRTSRLTVHGSHFVIHDPSANWPMSWPTWPTTHDLRVMIIAYRLRHQLQLLQQPTSHQTHHSRKVTCFIGLRLILKVKIVLEIWLT